MLKYQIFGGLINNDSENFGHKVFITKDGKYFAASSVSVNHDGRVRVYDDDGIHNQDRSDIFYLKSFPANVSVLKLDGNKATGGIQLRYEINQAKTHEDVKIGIYKPTIGDNGEISCSNEEITNENLDAPITSEPPTPLDEDVVSTVDPINLRPIGVDIDIDPTKLTGSNVWYPVDTQENTGEIKFCVLAQVLSSSGTPATFVRTAYTFTTTLTSGFQLEGLKVASYSDTSLDGTVQDYTIDAYLADAENDYARFPDNIPPPIQANSIISVAIEVEASGVECKDVTSMTILDGRDDNMKVLMTPVSNGFVDDSELTTIEKRPLNLMGGGQACIVNTYARPSIFLEGTTVLNITGEVELQFGTADSGFVSRRASFRKLRKSPPAIATTATTVVGGGRGSAGGDDGHRSLQSDNSLPKEEFTLKATLDPESIKSGGGSTRYGMGSLFIALILSAMNALL